MKEWEEKRKLEKEKEIEEQKRILREMEEEKNNTEGPSFAPLSAQDLAVCYSFYFS